MNILHPARIRTLFTPPGAFTLLELLVVIGVISVLAAISFPVLTAVRARADQAKCSSNLRQITVAASLCANDNNLKYPALHVYGFDSNVYMPDLSTSTWYDSPTPPSIGEVLAPYLGFPPVNTINVSPEVIPVIFRCPAAAKNTAMPWLTSNACYRYNGYATGRSLPSSGASLAMLFIDATWGDWSPSQFSHRSPVGINVAYADGHVALMPYDEYHAVNPSSSGEYQHPLFMNGWLQPAQTP